MEITYGWTDDSGQEWHLTYTVPDGSDPDMLEGTAEFMDPNPPRVEHAS